MISSMTGYGEAEGQVNDVTYVVEIKTVNNRYFKARIKLPDAMAFLEQDIESLLQANLCRGTANYTLHLKNVSANALFDINESALRTCMKKLNEIASSAGIKGTVEISSLLTLPGIISPAAPDKQQCKRIKHVILDTTQQAIEKIKKMRSAEGAALAADLKEHCQTIKQDLDRIRNHRIDSPKEYAQKLRKRIDALLADAKLRVDEETLAREVAIFADKSDVSEEIARLDSHLQQFTESCNADDQAGRRLEFISQEMLREANTIASKASNAEIIRCVVNIKCYIDRIKEQVQNIV